MFEHVEEKYQVRTTYIWQRAIEIGDVIFVNIGR